jgi:hypothetical protein
VPVGCERRPSYAYSEHMGDSHSGDMGHTLRHAEVLVVNHDGSALEQIAIAFEDQVQRRIEQRVLLRAQRLLEDDALVSVAVERRTLIVLFGRM